MYNHAPEDYKCPICLAIKGIESDDTWIIQDDIFYRDDLVTGFISSKFIKGNEGHPVLVPNEHYENLYDLSEIVGHRIFDVSKRIATALKKIRGADGITIHQSNEPAGDQHAFHYHLHVVPRFNGDHFHEELWKASRSQPEERTAFAKTLRDLL
ncbi:HIT family protein [Candidatus Uhrbacteria bacterium]|nr:HIT family protein [Candidatus Uhrbacteria bacterium]